MKPSAMDPVALFPGGSQTRRKRQGIIIADTKFGSLGLDRSRVDPHRSEVLTPDSSRFWQADLWRPGQAQPSYDKQFVRDYLETLNWNKQPPGPELPPEVVAGTRARYVEAYERIVGSPFHS